MEPTQDIGQLTDNIADSMMLGQDEISTLAQANCYSLYSSKGGLVLPKRRYWVKERLEGNADVLLDVKGHVAHLPDVEQKDVKKVVNGFEVYGWGGIGENLRILSYSLILGAGLTISAMLSNDAESHIKIYEVIAGFSFIAFPFGAVCYFINEMKNSFIKSQFKRYESGIADGKEAIETAFGGL